MRYRLLGQTGLYVSELCHHCGTRLLNKPFVTTVIIGAKSMDQLRDNIDPTRVRLDDAEIQQLDEISALPAEYPGWMLAFQGQARAKPPVKK